MLEKIAKCSFAIAGILSNGNRNDNVRKERLSKPNLTQTITNILCFIYIYDRFAQTKTLMCKYLFDSQIFILLVLFLYNPLLETIENIVYSV